MLDSIKAWKHWKRFRSLPQAERRITFYAEDKASFVHYEPILHELTHTLGRTICYLTSVSDDPILDTDNPRIKPFYIGKGTICTLAFSLLKTDVMVMTMPDLDSFHIRRSKSAPVHYVYLFHSIVSTHMIYREQAFDNYDTILCVGPHHETEIRNAETLRGLKPKKLIPHGYGRLDSLLVNHNHAVSREPNSQPHVLIAPSWGPNGIIETLGCDIPRILLDAGFRVTLRPHPMTLRKSAQRVHDIETRYGNHPNFLLETDIRSSNSLEQSDLMISDYSGVAFEYAFTYERPVLFINLPPKVNNPAWQSNASVPVEISLREHLGLIVNPEDIEKLPAMVHDLAGNPGRWKKQIQQVRDNTVYNCGNSGLIGAQAIATLADQKIQEQGNVNERILSTTS